VRNLSVAVWVDGELTDEEKDRIRTMVSSAAGLQPERGDVVQVDGMAFARELDVPADAPILARGWLYSWRYILLLAAVGLLLLILAFRRRRREEEPAVEPVPEVPLLEPEEEIIERQLTPEEEQRLRVRREIERMANEDPEGLARLIRAWMIED
jgi:flagellar M-ring protein FliF